MKKCETPYDINSMTVGFYGIGGDNTRLYWALLLICFPLFSVASLQTVFISRALKKIVGLDVEFTYHSNDMVKL